MPGEGQEADFVLTSLAAYIKAYRNNLVPHWGFDPFDQTNWKGTLPLSLPWHLMKEYEMEELRKETEQSAPPRNTESEGKERGKASFWETVKTILRTNLSGKK